MRNRLTPLIGLLGLLILLGGTAVLLDRSALPAQSTYVEPGIVSIVNNKGVRMAQEPGAVDSISFTVDNVYHEQVLVYSYQPANNADSDGDSDGTVVTVHKP